MLPRLRTTSVAGLLAAVVVVTGCGGGDDPTVAGGDSGASATDVRFDDADVAFVSGMVPHHRQAVEMAELVLAKDPSEPVRALAERISAAQEPEIDQLEAMLAAFGEKPPGGGHGGHGGHGAGGGSAAHAGIMTEDQLQQLRQATGTDAERLFLTLMVEHHAGAVDAAETEIVDGVHPPAVALARRIRDDQQAEIAEMQQLLTTL